MDKANVKGIPVFGSEVEQVKLGCAAAANIDYYKLGIMTGKMAAEVLNGKDITTIPYETITMTLKEFTTVLSVKLVKQSTWFKIASAAIGMSAGEPSISAARTKSKQTARYLQSALIFT